MCGLATDVALPGLALPEAFQSLDTHLESVMQLCTAKGSPEAQLIGMITICEDLKQLLKCAFIGALTYSSKTVHTHIYTLYYIHTLVHMYI